MYTYIIRYHFLSPSPCEHLVSFTPYPPLLLRVRKRERRHQQNKTKQTQQILPFVTSHDQSSISHKSQVPLTRPTHDSTLHPTIGPRLLSKVRVPNDSGGKPCREPSATSNQQFSTHKSTRASWEKTSRSSLPSPSPTRQTHP